MNIILLSGGSGKRLWPLSNEIRSKQFIKIFRNEEGDYESMLQRVWKQIHLVDPDVRVTIATSKPQISAITNQLGEQVEICVEPSRKDTFPAVVLAAAYLKTKKRYAEDEVIAVCPIDPYVEPAYFQTVENMCMQLEKSDCNIALMGIEPTYPSEKYGYILPEDSNFISRVKEFREKPDESTAQKYIEQGALWNGGVFAFRLSYILEKAKEMISFINYDELFERYDQLEKISFDYAVLEKEEKILAVRYKGKWKDLGTWNTLAEAMDECCVGEAILNQNCQNVHVVNELDLPILCMGLKDLIVSASPEGILVSDKKESSYIKPYIEEMDKQIMFAEKSWGSFRVLEVEEESLTIKVTLNPGHGMNYHSHERRDEVWTVVSGNGRSVIDGVEQNIVTGDVIMMPAGCRHTVFADTELQIIEVQMGKEISVLDKVKHDLDRSKVMIRGTVKNRKYEK